MKKFLVLLIMFSINFSVIYADEDSNTLEEKSEKKSGNKTEIKLKASKITRISGTAMFIPGTIFTVVSFPLLALAEIGQAEYE